MAPLRADTPTFTPTDSPTVTVTPTITPGDGTWAFVPGSSPLVAGSAGNTAVLTYNNGPAVWDPGDGLLTILFPNGLSAPSPQNFYAQPTYSSYIDNYYFSGQTVQITIRNLPAGSSLPFYYGYSPNGFAVSTTNTPLSFSVMAYPQSAVLGTGGVVAPASPPGSVPVATATVTPTFTISQTPTVSPTFSQSPTVTVSPTITVTFTQTPIGTVTPNAVYSYPNPFDLRVYQKCTFLFPGDSSAQVTVFNLVGEPVREIPSSDINAAQGWAIWPGVDDYLRPVAGGLYFVRVRAPKGLYVKHFTVLH